MPTNPSDIEFKRDCVVFFTTSIVSIAIFACHIYQNWHYPWFGNPDQDLVFLRDGLRIARHQIPGYSDHPGLFQMLVGALSHLISGTTTKTYLSDQNWQAVFQVQKIINALVMAALIGSASALLARRTRNRSLATLVGITCALSIGTTTLLYQLRNEFYSAYLFFAAALIAIGIAESRITKDDETSSIDQISIVPIFSYSLLVMLSLLAKVQALPLLILLSLGLTVWLYGISVLGLKKLIHSVVKAVMLTMLLAAIFKLTSIDVGGSIAGYSTILILTIIPLHIATTAGPGKLSLYANGDKEIALLYGVTSLVYAKIIQINSWQHISWNPYSASKYTQQGLPKNGLEWYLSRGSEAYKLLFERSFDGQLLAHLLAILLPLAFAGCLVKIITSHASLPGAKRRCKLTYLSAIYLYVCAAAMSVIASLRWPVDHYLPYQQPLLFMAVFLVAFISRSPLAFKVVAIYMTVSVILLNISYSKYAYLTYVKISTPASLNGPILIPQKAINNRSLCASQHAGPEWRGSIIESLCNY